MGPLLLMHLPLVLNTRHLHLKNVIFSYLNVNSIMYKFGDVDKIRDGNIDILCITETKLDESFPNIQFVLVGYHLQYRRDITDNKRWLDGIC